MLSLYDKILWTVQKACVLNQVSGDVLMGVVDAFDVYEMQDIYKQDPVLFVRGRLRVLTLLAGAATSKMIGVSSKTSRDDARRTALEFIGRADKIDAACVINKLCKAVFWIGELHHDSGALRNARYHADLVLHDTSCTHLCQLVALSKILPVHMRGCARQSWILY